MESFGKIAYDAYGEERKWTTFDAGVMPPWEEQTPELRKAWEAAAKAVMEAVGL